MMEFLDMMDKNLTRRLLDICYNKKLHHLGSYFSCLDLIDKIYSQMSNEDIFILSNGHSVVSLYVVLEKYFGFNAEELLEKYGEHPKRNENGKIHCSTGSLGMGITVAVGRALAKPNRNVYCMISDGEAAEGSVWEALRFSHEKNLKNIKIYVNANGWAAYDAVDLDYLENRIRCFNPNVKFVRTTVEHYGLEGLHAHYTNFTEEQYKSALETL